MAEPAAKTAHWVKENTRANSYKYICSECHGLSYFIHSDELGEFCTHCGIPMITKYRRDKDNG